MDKNIDKNSLSKDAKTHFHGTAATVLQFQTSKNQGQQRLRKKISEYYYGKKLDNREFEQLLKLKNVKTPKKDERFYY